MIQFLIQFFNFLKISTIFLIYNEITSQLLDWASFLDRKMSHYSLLMIQSLFYFIVFVSNYCLQWPINHDLSTGHVPLVFVFSCYRQTHKFDTKITQILPINDSVLLIRCDLTLHTFIYNTFHCHSSLQMLSLSCSLSGASG